MSPRNPRILGVDPSLTGTGIAWDTHQYTCKGDGDQRLHVIYRTITDLAEKTPFDMAVVEDLPTHGMGAGKTGMAQGVVRLALQVSRVPYVTVPPATLKVYATGRGNATKPDMRVELLQRTRLDLRDDNQVDATWLKHLGADLLGQPTLHLPQTHRRALAKLTLPHNFPLANQPL